MIPLNNTGDTVIMLLVAGGVGLIGGIGAGLLEIRRDPEKAKQCGGTIVSSIFLGGIAAIAILYFFPPEETSAVAVEGTAKIVKEYNLTKLVALALIVGSAGASFLLVLQKRTLDIAEAKEEVAEKTAEVAKKAGEVKTIQAQASEAIQGVGNQATALARASVVEGAAPAIEKALKKASAGKPAQATATAVAAVLDEVGGHAQSAAEDSIEPFVEDAQKRILATSLGTDPAGKTDA